MSGELYHGQYPVDMTPAEALRELQSMRPMPILMFHFPSAPSIDFNDASQRRVVRCSCGEVWHDTTYEAVLERWAYHATSAVLATIPAHRTLK